VRHDRRRPRNAEHDDSLFAGRPRHESRQARRRRTTLRRTFGIAIGLAVLALAAGAGLLHSGLHPTAHAALSSSDCPATPTSATPTTSAPTVTTAPPSAPTTSTGATTLLGVNATSPSQLTTRTGQFGHMPMLRVYYTGMPDPNLWTTGVQGLNHSGVVVSFRSPPSTVLSGADDAALAKFFDSAPTGYPIYWSYYHEPELLVQAGTFTVDQYKAAWAHIAAIAAAAHNADLKSTLILMTWDFNPASGINWKDYLPPGNVISVLGWDAYPAGTVHDSNPQPTPPADFMGAAEAASRQVGLPFGFAEFALGTQTDRPQWLATVASYLRSTGALFGTLFDSTGFPWMELTDGPSIQAWHAVIGTSGSGLASAPSSPAPSPLASSEQANPPAEPVGSSISQARVDPAAFVPTGQNHVRILFKLSQPADVAICVLDSHGAVQRELNRASDPAGWSSIWYFGHNTAGALLPAGTYPVVIAATNSSGSTVAQTKLTIGAGSST
jgi:hypothetical protein